MVDPYISEIRYLGQPDIDFVEVAVDAGSSVADLYIVVYNETGLVRSTTQLTAAGVSGPAQFGGRDIYVVDESSENFTGLHRLGAVALVQSADGVTADEVFGFYSFHEASDSIAATDTITAQDGLAEGLTSQEIGAADRFQSLVIEKSAADANADDSGNYTATAAPWWGSPSQGSIPCFTPGTLITTVTGQVAVEALKPGDLIVTLDNGLQPIRWTGARTISGIDRFDPAMRPICVPAKGSSHFLPTQDLYVSPNHCLLLIDPLNGPRFGAEQVLVPAQFVFPPSTVTAHLPPSYTYNHVLFDAHEVIFANGLPVESLHPSHIALGAFGRAGKLLELSGVHMNYGPTARRVLKRYEAALIQA